VLARALSVNPANRYASVLDFSAAFADSIANPVSRGGQPRVFLSYHRHSSSGWANYLAQGLEEKHGCSVFVDTHAQDGAPRIPDRIRNEIARSDVFVCMLAPQTLTSRWVREEIEVAFRSDKPMVPVFHEDFSPKDQVDPGESVRALLDFEAVHLLDRRNIKVKSTIAELAAELTVIGHVGSVTPLLQGVWSSGIGGRVAAG
jgi:hypothetical protein